MRERRTEISFRIDIFSIALYRLESNAAKCTSTNPHTKEEEEEEEDGWGGRE